MEPPEPSAVAVSIRGLSKRYASGHEALRQVDLDIRRGEIFALLGPNGAGKTTLISIVCGLVTASAGRVSVDGLDIAQDWRAARARVGLVPQELTTDAFETVWNAVRFSRGLFGRPADAAYLETVLRDLSLWDKRDAQLITLSGGMKRRLLIAKALAHEPSILFLDEPTAGVDVELRREMWSLVRRLRERGTTIILTTHYIEEAEEMADRVGVIHEGALVIVEDKRTLMKKLGKRVLRIELERPLSALPPVFAGWPLALTPDGCRLEYHVGADGEAGTAADTNGDGTADRTTGEHADGSAEAHADRKADEPGRAAHGIGPLLAGLAASGIGVRDIESHETSLEEIFVGLVSRRPPSQEHG